MVNALYVSANRAYRPDMSLDDIKEAILSGWRITVAKAQSADVVVAFVGDTAAGAWRLIDAYPSNEDRKGERRKLANLVLGVAVPLTSTLARVPRTRDGIALVDLERQIIE